MNKVINVALIGCGRVAGHHARSIENIPDYANLVSVCDLIDDRRNELGKTHNVPTYNNYFEMLEKHPEIDVVSIITPSGMHYEHASDVIVNYKKHVIIEKPMFMTLGQGEELKQKAHNSGVEIFPVFQYRFNKAVQKIRETCNNKQVKPIRHIHKNDLNAIL